MAVTSLAAPVLLEYLAKKLKTQEETMIIG
jgi:hypothetical protein